MAKARSGFVTFEARAAEAARTLLRHQGYDGGWGLTLTSVSSIVNSGEVLPILRVAGIAGQPLRHALDFLTTALPEHCRLRSEGGRGEHTRFVAFGMTGLLSHPRSIHYDAVAQTLAWCVDWLDAHRVDDGWPEVRGLNDTSLHQTALVVHGLAQFRDTLHDLGPGLVLPGAVDTTGLLEWVEPLIDHGIRGLLYHRRSSGAWGWRTYVDTDPSPSKTALSLLALSAVTSGRGPRGEPAYRDVLRDSGGVHGLVQRKRLSEVVADAGQWLLCNHHRWETLVENDKDVRGTAWEHMAYALCARAAVRAGASPLDPRLSKAWRLMDELWDPEVGMWNEPGASGRRATVRAAYYTLSAYEEAAARLARIGLRGQVGAGDHESTAEIVIVSAELVGGNTILLTTPSSEGPVACVLSERMFDLAKVVHDHRGEGAPTEQIARALFLAPSSVPKYVQRLNQAVSTALGGAPARLLHARTVDGGSGYAWARSETTG